MRDYLHGARKSRKVFVRASRSKSFNYSRRTVYSRRMSLRDGPSVKTSRNVSGRDSVFFSVENGDVILGQVNDGFVREGNIR